MPKIDVNKLQVKLTDFGSCIIKSENKFRTCQTRYYRAPEVILNLKYDEKIDVWSLGCTLYELLTLKLFSKSFVTNIDPMYPNPPITRIFCNLFLLLLFNSLM